ncbi:MAG: hypothetical protein R6U50_09950 [Desulfobacterales bacterium]
MAIPDQNGVRELPKRRFRKARKWSLLFVDDAGRVVSFLHLKELAVSLAIVTPVFLISAGLYVAFSLDWARENRQMAEQLKHFEHRIEKLESENRNLLLRLVKKESVTDKAAAKTPTDTGDVAVDGFFITSDTQHHRIHIQYTLSKIGEEKKAVAGYTSVLLRDGSDNRLNRIVLPAGAKAGGDSGDYARGHAFSIENFKPIKLSTTAAVPLESYTSAAVYVYDTAGVLLLEKEIAIEEPTEASGA